MKSIKTTLLGVFGGGTVILDAIVDAAKAGAFDHKSLGQAFLGVVVIALGVAAKDHSAKLIIFVTICMASLLPSSSNAQGLLSRLPKPVPQKYTPAKANVFFKATPTSLQFDSVFQGLRIGGPSVMIAVPDFTVYTGVGIEWQHDTYQVKNQRWYKDYGIGADFFGGGQLAPGNIREVAAVGAHVSLLDGFVTVGFLYNLTTKKVQAATGPMSQLFGSN